MIVILLLALFYLPGCGASLQAPITFPEYVTQEESRTIAQEEIRKMLQEVQRQQQAAQTEGK